MQYVLFEPPIFSFFLATLATGVKLQVKPGKTKLRRISDVGFEYAVPTGHGLEHGIKAGTRIVIAMLITRQAQCGQANQ